MTERQQFKVLRTYENFELREYLPCVIAEVRVSGQFSTSSSSAFSTLFSYISKGNNSSQKIAMTAPVTVTPIPSGWRLHFVMPSQEKLDTLPKPNNSQVAIRRVADHEMVSIRFSGWATASAIKENTDRLTEWALSRQLTLVGTPQVARYNDPFTLPWRRRNEILIEIAKDAIAK